MIKAILLVGLGSAGGGIMRYLVGKWTHSLIATSFPLGTMIVNVLGCFVIGLVYSIFSKNSTSAAESLTHRVCAEMFNLQIIF